MNSTSCILENVFLYINIMKFRLKKRSNISLNVFVLYRL